MPSIERLSKVFELAYKILRDKITGGIIIVENEASLQLQFSAILKQVGELFEIHRDEYFSIELEKPLSLYSNIFSKSGTKNAKIDIFYSFVDAKNNKKNSCAVEVKYFKMKNHREPNNRYDVYADLHNLENYGSIAECCFMVVATDHSHYVSQEKYSENTKDFDFRHETTYKAGTIASYRTTKEYGMPITLRGTYEFMWDKQKKGLHFLKVHVNPNMKC